MAGLRVAVRHALHQLGDSLVQEPSISWPIRVAPKHELPSC